MLVFLLLLLLLFDDFRSFSVSDRHSYFTTMLIKYYVCSILTLCLVALASAAKETLVLLNNLVIKETHSILFNTLKGRCSSSSILPFTVSCCRLWYPLATIVRPSAVWFSKRSRVIIGSALGELPLEISIIEKKKKLVKFSNLSIKIQKIIDPSTR